MGLFYDPIKKKPQPWVFIALVAVPILIIIFGFIWGSSLAKKNSAEEKQETSDNFFKNFKSK